MDFDQLIAHLGGRQFFLLTGFKAEVRGETYIQFKATKNKLGATKMKVSLVNDLYTIEFFKIRNFEVTTVKKIEGVYDVNLREVFERETGLYTRF